MARIIIAEDQPQVREFCARALQSAGHQVQAVEDGMRALEALGAAEFDLLLTDIVMPEMDGIALALKVAKDYPNLRILMMTGFAAEKQRAYNLEALIHDVLTKPFSLSELVAAVDAALGQQHASRG